MSFERTVEEIIRAPMTRRLSEWLIRVSRGWVALAALLIFLIFTPLVLPDQAATFEAAAGPGPSPDLSFFYTPADLYRMAESFGPAGRTAYVRARWTFDVVWPLVYTTCLVTSISWLSGKAFAPGSRGRQLNLMPVVGMLLDFGENICASLVIARYPARTPDRGLPGHRVDAAEMDLRGRQFCCPGGGRHCGSHRGPGGGGQGAAGTRSAPDGGCRHLPDSARSRCQPGTHLPDPTHPAAQEAHPGWR